MTQRVDPKAALEWVPVSDIQAGDCIWLSETESGVVTSATGKKRRVIRYAPTFGGNPVTFSAKPTSQIARQVS